ncbi:MAG: hypothetical protein CVV42_15770 [Candidatus Riflebacteria bacterium HGW-Riflebacteria-2]|jgi:hypothetical protein|nr:MAG: hypothetical protein CVV42_15770 [Candidatus Riflebacteria bacterium HGW-Riflebacteria-2]
MTVSFRQLMSILVLALVLTSNGAYADTEWLDATHLFEAEVREVVETVERETLQQQAARFRTQSADTRPYEVGDIETFWTKNIVDNNFEQTKAVLKAIGKHCYVFLEEGKNISPDAIEKVRKNFDEVIYPTNTRTFGSEWKPGIDGDERITLLMFDIKDGYNGSGGFVGGYFYAVDSFLQEKLPEHVKSNQREMFYLDINPSDPASDRYLSTIAHEFQHMIHFNNDPSEYTWVNEACSQIAPYLCGFGHANQVLAYMRTPDNSMTAWSNEQMLANYGQVYLWNYYILTHLLKDMPEARGNFFRNLVASKKQGVNGYVEALKTISHDFTHTFTRFCITNFINDARLGKNGAYAYDKTLARFKLPMSETLSALPAEVEGEIFLWSSDAIKIDLSKARSQVEISFAGLLGRFGEDLYNSFTVALVMANSRGSVAPKLSYMSIDKISSNLQGGKLTVAADQDYDTATLIIIAEAPESVDDKLYTKAKALPYSVKIVDQGQQVARSEAATDVRSLVKSYAEAAENLSSENEAALMIAMNSLASARSDIARAFTADIAAGNTASLDTLIQMLENQEVDSDNLRPLLNQLAAVAQFNAANTSSDSLSKAASQLRAY